MNVTVTEVSAEHERVLKQDTERFRHFAQAAGDWFWETDADGRLIQLETGDDTACPLYRGSVLGEGLIPEGDITVEQVLSRTVLFRDLRLRTVDDRWIKLNGLPMTNADGRLQGFRGTARDVTDLVSKDQALVKALRRARLLEAAVDATPANITVVDARVPGLPLSVVNKSFCTTTGFTVGEVIGQNCRFLQGPDTEPEALDALRRALGAKEPIELTLTNYRKDGTRFLNYLQIAPVRDAEGEVMAFVGVQRDVTQDEERRAAQATRERLEALGRLAGGIAHEINNLLQPILTLPEGIGLVLPDTATEERADLVLMSDAARTARDLLASFLTFARGDAEVHTKVNCLDTFSTALDLVAALQPPSVRIKRKGAFLENTGLGQIVASRTQIMQVLSNLIGNAAQAMSGFGVIEVDLQSRDTASGPCIRLTVSDHGHGMDEATRARMFEPFFTTRSVGHGTGLGLSLVYGIVRTWHGAIDVKSQPGVGTAISIDIPSINEP